MVVKETLKRNVIVLKTQFIPITYRIIIFVQTWQYNIFVLILNWTKENYRQIDKLNALYLSVNS